MSSKRIVLSCLVLAFAVIAGSWYAVGAFPMWETAAAAPVGNTLIESTGTTELRAQARETVGAVNDMLRRAPRARQAPAGSDIGPLERTAKPVTPENPIPRRTYSVTPPNPSSADGGVLMLTLRVTVNGLGRVAEVRALSGTVGGRGAAAAGRAGGRAAVASPDGSRPAPSQQAFAQSTAFVQSVTNAVRQWIYDPPADPPIAFDVTFAFAPGSEARLVSHGGFMGAPGTRVGGPPPPPPPPPPGGATSFNWANGAVRVGGNIKAPTKTKDVRPEYPPIAMQARVQGVVILETLIGADGRVEEARVLRSIPLLDQAAIDAVKQWEFTPTLLNGAPVPVIVTMTVQFSVQ
jgi:TonB family protein